MIEVTDKAVLALATKIAVATGMIREGQELSHLEPQYADGAIALAQEYVQVVRDADGGKWREGYDEGFEDGLDQGSAQ